MKVTAKELDEIDRKIIQKIADGLTAKEIGRELNISQHSVQARTRHMKAWYGCKSSAQLVAKLGKQASK